ncbi:MAG: hypothetical protein GF311_19475 [Candidatus Lokiarchaeota archaeon]|nr:hypothetical protein [Candidatus Lokiarchaeota archaeon]
MKKLDLLKLVKEYNVLMKCSISGPDCTDHTICEGDCCGIQIDVPKVLAEEYIKRGYATQDDFIRSNIFSFKLRFDDKKAKCFLFDPEINGCSIHHSGIKPPQCWIYPTKFCNRSENISCKITDGWKITNFKKTRRAKELLKRYNSFCLNEAEQEIQMIDKRIGNSLQSSKYRCNIIAELKGFKPSELGGFQDGWDQISPLPAEGFSLQLKKFCQKNPNQCEYMPENYFECPYICKDIANSLICFFRTHIYQLIKKRGIDPNGMYPFHHLFEFFDQ